MNESERLAHVEAKITTPLSPQEKESLRRACRDNLRVMGLIYQVLDPLRLLHEIETLQQDRQDMAHLLKRAVRTMGNHPSYKAVVTDYLKRKGLEGSVLR